MARLFNQDVVCWSENALLGRSGRNNRRIGQTCPS